MALPSLLSPYVVEPSTPISILTSLSLLPLSPAAAAQTLSSLCFAGRIRPSFHAALQALDAAAAAAALNKTIASLSQDKSCLLARPASEMRRSRWFSRAPRTAAVRCCVTVQSLSKLLYPGLPQAEDPSHEFSFNLKRLSFRRALYGYGILFCATPTIHDEVI